MDIVSLVLQIIPFAFIGAVVGLDTVSFPQVMLSRPIVSATLAGALAGDAMAGLTIGVVLEIMALDTLPFGASRYPEWGASGTVGGVVMALSSNAYLTQFTIAILAALVTALVSSWSMIVLRRHNVKIMRKYRTHLDAGSLAAVNLVQLLGILLDAARAGIITFAALFVFIPLSGHITDLWSINAMSTRAVIVAITASVALSGLWKLFNNTRHTIWYLLSGLLIGGGALLSR